MVWEIVFIYYECWDGKGYLFGLVGEQILIEGCIMVIIDVYDVLILECFYKCVFLVKDVLVIILESVGIQFDLELVEYFVSIYFEFQKQMQKFL